MRICTPHCGIDPESTSGGETYERELLRRLAAGGTVLDIVLARHKRHPDGVPNWVVHRLAMGRGLRWPVAMAVLPPVIGRLHRRTRFDVLRVHSLRFIGPAALIARKVYGLDVPVIAHHHHVDPDWLNPVIERRVVERVDHVVTGSEFSRRQMAAELRVRVDHVSVVPYGIEEKFQPGPRREDLVARHGLAGKRVVLFVGGLKPRKNLPRLLEIWRAVVSERPDACLVIAGGGPLAEALRAQAARLGVADRVVFTGYVPEADKPDYYRLADVFVFPSGMEGFGLAIGEAMSTGVPVVASDRGSIPELVVDGETGVLGDPDRVETFVRPLLALLGDPGLGAKLGAAGLERVDRSFRWERCVRDTARVYEDVLARWRARPGRR